MKRWLSILLMLCLLVSLCACGGNDNETNGNENGGESENHHESVWSNLPNADGFINEYKSVLHQTLGYGVEFDDFVSYEKFVMCTLLNGAVTLTYNVVDGKVPTACAVILPQENQHLSYSERIDAMTAMYLLSAMYNDTAKTKQGLYALVENLKTVDSETNIKKRELIIQGIRYSYQESYTLVTFQANYINNEIDDETKDEFDNTQDNEYNDSQKTEELVYYKGTVESCKNSLSGWRLVLSKTITANGENVDLLYDALYFYPDTFFGKHFIKEYEGAIITICGTVENYQNSGTYYIRNPILTFIDDVVVSDSISNENFESVVPLTVGENWYDNGIFSSYFRECKYGSEVEWKYVGSTYDVFGLDYYTDYVIVDVYKVSYSEGKSNYYFVPYHDLFGNAPVVFKFLEDGQKPVQVWFGAQ